MKRSGAFAACVATCCATASVCAAQPAPDSTNAQAEQLYEEGAFADALALLDANVNAERTRADLAEEQALRALLYYALDDEAQFERALQGLATLDSSYAFGPRRPPAIVERFESIRAAAAPLVVTALHGRAPDGIRVRAEVSGDPGGLVREVRVMARAGEGSWSAYAGPQATVPALSAERLSYYVIALGPGGVELGRFGSEEEPIEASAVGDTEPTAAAGGLGSDGLTTPPRQSRTGMWIGVGVGAAVLVGVVVAGFLVLRDPPESRTNVLVPVFADE